MRLKRQSSIMPTHMVHMGSAHSLHLPHPVIGVRRQVSSLLHSRSGLPSRQHNLQSPMYHSKPRVTAGRPLQLG